MSTFSRRQFFKSAAGFAAASSKAATADNKITMFHNVKINDDQNKPYPAVWTLKALQDVAQIPEEKKPENLVGVDIETIVMLLQTVGNVDIGFNKASQSGPVTVAFSDDLITIRLNPLNTLAENTENIANILNTLAKDLKNKRPVDPDHPYVIESGIVVPLGAPARVAEMPSGVARIDPAPSKTYIICKDSMTVNIDTGQIIATGCAPAHE